MGFVVLFPSWIGGKIMKTLSLTADRARSLFSYDAVTGILRWRTRRGGKIPHDLTAGYVDHEGYRVVCVDGVNHRAHRVIWLMVHGQWPSAMLDHENGHRSDNKLTNLREATNAQNQMNKKARTTGASGFKGVSIIRRRGRVQFRASVRYDGKTHVSGYFDTPEAAYEHYSREAVRVFGKFAKI